MELVALTSTEQKTLTELETTIERNLQSFYEIGIALMKIRDERLYRKDYETFEAYCQKRWQFQRNYANKLIASAGVVQNIGMGTIVPKTESQARPLTKLPPEKQAEVWNKAVETAPDGKVTAKHVEQVVEENAKQKPAFKHDYPETCAFNFSTVAIRQLERIPVDDPERDAALDSVIEWIAKNR